MPRFRHRFEVLLCAYLVGFAALGQVTFPELPRHTVDTRMPAQQGRTFNPADSAALRQALVQARDGDTIVLQAGSSYAGIVTLPARRGSGWVVLRSSAMDMLPQPGTRITPAHARHMPRIVSKANGEPALRAEPGARGYRFVGIEFTTDPQVRTLSAIVEISHNSTRLEDVPAHIVFDRVYIHGNPQLQSQRGLTLNSQWSAVVDSWIAECHMHGVDSQAIINWNGPGPFKIENNFLEGGSENIMFGGAKNTAPEMVASDIVVRRNHLYKNPAWAALKYPDNWAVKNLFEIKCARRLLFEGNVLENCWAEAQTGFAFVLKSASPDQGRTWDTTSDLTIRHNLILNSLNGFGIARWSSSGPVVPGAAPTSRILVEHNVFQRFGAASTFPSSGNGGILFQVSGIDFILRNNTAWSTYATLMVTKGGCDNLLFERNLVTSGSYFFHADGGKGAGWDAALLSHLRGDSRMVENAIIRVGDERARKTNPALFPPSNQWFDSFDEAGVHPDSLAAMPESRLRTQAGMSAGANLDAVLAATRGVRAEVP
jgi:hypothetical protein